MMSAAMKIERSDCGAIHVRFLEWAKLIKNCNRKIDTTTTKRPPLNMSMIMTFLRVLICKRHR